MNPSFVEDLKSDRGQDDVCVSGNGIHEHVIKLADTALDTYSWTGDTQALAAVETAASLIDPW